MKRKLSFLVLYGTLVLFGGLGALLLLFGEREPHASLTENRMLAGFPELSWGSVQDGSFMSGLEDFLSDNMPERDKLVTGVDLLMSRFSLDHETDEMAAENDIFDQVLAMGQSEEPPEAVEAVPTHTAAPTPMETAGTPPPAVPLEPVTIETLVPETETPAPQTTESAQKDLSTVPTCYFTYTRADGSEQVVYTFSSENIRRMIRVLNAYRALLPEDGHMFFAQPPFPGVAGKLQSGEYIGWSGELENTINEYSDEGVYMVNVQTVLEQPLLAGEYLYFRTDHHWTPRAACYTLNAILQTMGVDPKPYDSYEFTTYRDFYGSSAGNDPLFRTRNKPDTLEVLIPTTPVKGYRVFWDGSEREAAMLIDSHTYIAFLGGTQGPWRRFETGVDSGRSCLVIGDSFANCFVPFLTPYYETIHVTDVRADYYDRAHAQWTISDHIRENGIDDVYFILSTANGVNTVSIMDTLLACL